LNQRGINKLAKDLQKTSQENCFKDSRLRLLIKDKVYISTPEKKRQIILAHKQHQKDLAKMRAEMEKDPAHANMFKKRKCKYF
jgi:hypothetical protein